MRRAAVATLLAVLSLLAFPARALAVGEVTPAGCIDDNDTGDDICAQSVNGMDGARSVAVSPDGKSVYVASAGDDAIVRFDRNTTSGALTPAGCIDDNDTGTDTCAQSVNGLRDAFSVAVTADGRSVYVAAAGDDAIVRFNRDTTSGALTPGGCIDDEDTGDDLCVQSVPGLDGAVDVTVSGSGAAVYVASVSDDAIVRFNRSSTGALTPAGCFDDNDSGEDTCGGSVNGLSGVASVVVSPDGNSVYTASLVDEAVRRFIRSATGALTAVGCIDDVTGGDTCGQSLNGLGGAASVSVSRDGTSVYVAARGDNGVVSFSRSTKGALTPAGCADDNDTGFDTCAQSFNGLAGARSVTVSPDGSSVYVAADSDDAVVRFVRAPNGALSQATCIDDNDTGADSCAQAVNGLDSAESVVVSPDGKSVYAAGEGDDAIVRFNRQTT